MKQILPSTALNSLQPLPLVFIISIDSLGKPSGLLASWFTQTSFNPPLVSVSIGKTRNTHNLIKDSGEFVVALPNKKLEKAALLFGTRSARSIDKFKAAKLQTSPSKFLKSPLLTEANLNLECKLVHNYDSGDHTIFVGLVLAAWGRVPQKSLYNFGTKNGRRVFKEI